MGRESETRWSLELAVAFAVSTRAEWMLRRRATRDRTYSVKGTVDDWPSQSRNSTVSLGQRTSIWVRLGSRDSGSKQFALWSTQRRRCSPVVRSVTTILAPRPSSLLPVVGPVPCRVTQKRGPVASFRRTCASPSNAPPTKMSTSPSLSKSTPSANRSFRSGTSTPLWSRITTWSAG